MSEVVGFSNQTFRVSEISMKRLRYLVSGKDTLSDNYDLLETQYPIHQLQIVIYDTDFLLLEDVVVKKKFTPNEILTLAHKPMFNMIDEAATFYAKRDAREYLLALCQYKSYTEKVNTLDFNISGKNGRTFNILYHADADEVIVADDSNNWTND